MMNSRRMVLYASMLLAPMWSMAAEEGVRPFLSVEQNIYAMDKDHDGMVSVYEVRAFMEAKHGKGYQKAALDEMESTASGKSCTTPFAKPMYSSK